MALTLLKEVNKFKTSIFSFCLCVLCIVYAIKIIKKKSAFNKHILLQGYIRFPTTILNFLYLLQ